MCACHPFSPETLQLDSEAVLNSIAAQHGLLVERTRGIYSFSHLTFQEYFTARWFKKKADGDFAALIGHVTDQQWREVFLLTVGMLKSADQLLQGMKREIDGLLAQDEKLQEFLGWVEEKSSSVEASYKPAAVRAYYLIRDLNFDRALVRAIAHAVALTRACGSDLNMVRTILLTRARNGLRDRDLAIARALDLTFDLALNLVLAHTPAPGLDIDLALDHNLDFALDLAQDLDLAIARALDLTFDLDFALFRAHACACKIKSTELQESLQHLEDRLPDTSSENYENFERWWKANGRDWTEELRAIMIQHRNISHDWQFSGEQEKLLQQYYDANKLLVDCLNSDCYVSREVRAEIEASLLLPIA